MLEFFRFELRYRFRQPSVYIFSLLFALLAFGATTTDAIMIGGATGQTAINGPHVITMILAMFSMLSVLLIVAMTAGAVSRDYDLKTYSLFFTKPIARRDYLLGRFFGGIFCVMLVMAGAALGLAVGALMPWLDPQRLVDNSPVAYLQPLLVFVLPNVLTMGAIFFALATLTRRMLYAYVGVVVFYVVYGVTQAFIGDLDNQSIAAFTDPFGLGAIELATRYWTPAERNSMVVPLEGVVLFNRLLWLGVAATFLMFTVVRFKMQVPAEGRPVASAEDEARVLQPDAPLPPVTLHSGPRVQLMLLRTMTRIELAGILRSTAFLIILLFAGLQVFAVIQGTASHMFGTPVYPVTGALIGMLDDAMALFLLIVVTFYAGELVWRDRKVKMADVTDALPVPNWVLLTSKLVALWGACAVVMVMGVVVSVGVQLAKGYTDLEPVLYLQSLLLDFPAWMMLAVLAIFFQVMANNRFIGYGLMLLYFVALAALGPLGFEHHLYRYADIPGEPYSDMNGYGHFLEAGLWFRLYWGLAAFVLALISNLFWARGTDNRFRLRLRQARQRVTKLNTALLAVGTLGFFATGSYIFYNTNVLHDFVPSEAAEQLAQTYEEEFKQYENLPQPRLIATEVFADLYPDERRLEIRGTMRLRNKTDARIETLHVRIDPDIRINALALPDEAIEKRNDELGYRIYRLDEPLEPGAEMDFTFDFTFEETGFKSRGSSRAIVHNGTFFHNDTFVPHFGYDRGGELSDANERRKRGLPERERMAPVDDLDARMNTYVSNEADWIDFKATVSTSAEQFALAPGYLVKEWERDGRRYFRYEMDAPILNMWAILSARYEVARDSWNGIPIEVYYHRPHDYNVQRMIEAVKASLDYYTENFSPYQHRQVRIVEFPSYRTFAQSLPNIIPYSESVGFIADLRDEEDIDYVYYVTAHEIAHQWWAHQVIGGNVQGSTLMSETLAQYSALMVMEKTYGKAQMKKFLEHELNSYLGGRGVERHKEQPLSRVENQPYIHYNKGSLAMYALREYIGEDTVNGALARYIEKTKFQQPPFTNSVEFISELRAVTPEKYAYLIEDMFETITLYDNRALSAKARELEDGRYEVSLEVQTAKYRADERGAEQPVDVHDWIMIGVYGAEGSDDAPLYEQLHQLRGGQTTITVTVDGKPVRAGIDPNILLIDRAPKDNVTRVQ